MICLIWHQTNFTKRQARVGLWGMIQRIMRPGSKYDMMLVISGEQGVGKSQFGKSIATLKWNGGYVYHR